MATTRDIRRILINDDGSFLSDMEPVLTVRDLKEHMVDTYKNTPVDALLWCLGKREVYHYESQIGEIPTERRDQDQDQRYVKAARTMSSLIEESGGPLTAMVKLCQKDGLDLFPSLRMNSHYAADPNAPGSGVFRREHPNVLIGKPGEELPKGSLEWGVRTGVDYVHPEVRSHMAAIICELMERFAINGIELDYMRHPTFFRPQDGYANRHLMTDLLRYVKRRRDEISEAQERSIDIAVRVPPTLEDSLRLGLDVPQWMSERLVDIVIAGGGFIPFDTPIRDFVEAAGTSGCLIYGCIENLRPAVEDEIIRGIASHFWAEGASGIYLFNFFGKSHEWKKRVLAEIADPDALSRLSKKFQIDQTRFRPGEHRHWSTRDLHDYAFQNAVPAVQLPVVLAETHASSQPSLKLNVGDDVESASKNSMLLKALLTLQFDNMKGEDELEVTLNGQVLSSGSCKISYGTWNRLEWTGFPTRLSEVSHEGGTMEFELSCPPLQNGYNEIQVRLVQRTVGLSELLVLSTVEISLEYN